MIGGGTAGLFERTSRKLADYVGKEFGGGVRYAVEYHEIKKIPDPDPLDRSPSSAARMIYNEKIKEIVKEKMRLKKDLEKLYSIVWGQCTPAMKAKLRAVKDFEDTKKNLDSITLLKEIKKLSYNFQDKNYVPAAIHTVLDRFFNCKQKEETSDQKYLDMFNDNVKTIKSYNIIMNVADLIIKQEHGDTTNTNDEEKKELKEKAQERFLAYSYLKGMCKVRYGGIKEELHNEFLKGTNNYPKTVQEAYELQVGYWRKNPKRNNNGTGVSFFNKKITCFKCGKEGHISTSPECPHSQNNNQTTNNQTTTTTSTATNENSHNSNQNETVQHNNFQTSNFHFLTHHLSYSSNEGNDQYINNLRNWILLDSQTTVDIFCNPGLLTNVHDSQDKIILHTNTGEMEVTKKGELNGYGQVWFDHRAMTNILSLHNVKKKHPVTYDSSNGDRFIVHKPEKKLYFTCSRNGLYYHDTRKR